MYSIDYPGILVQGIIAYLPFGKVNSLVSTSLRKLSLPDYATIFVGSNLAKHFSLGSNLKRHNSRNCMTFLYGYASPQNILPIISNNYVDTIYLCHLDIESSWFIIFPVQFNQILGILLSIGNHRCFIIQWGTRCL